MYIWFPQHVQSDGPQDSFKPVHYVILGIESYGPPITYMEQVSYGSPHMWSVFMSYMTHMELVSGGPHTLYGHRYHMVPLMYLMVPPYLFIG